MDGFSVALVAVAIVALISGVAWYRRRERRITITGHVMRCPLYEDTARITVRTDPAAQSCRQYLSVATCSLLSDVAIGLPERIGYLADSPPEKVRFEPPASHAVYATRVDCPQGCVFVLNETAVTNALPQIACTSGVSDAFDLARQVTGNPRIVRLASYYGPG